MLTFKAIPSNKAALAATLAYISTYDNFYSSSEFFSGIEKKRFEEIIGKSMIKELDSLSNKDYTTSSVEKIKGNAAAVSILKAMKQMDPSPFMNNVCESIDKGLIDFTSNNINENYYILIFSPEYAATLYLLRNENPNSHEDEIRSIGQKLFSDFKSNPELMKKFLDEIERNQETEMFRKLWMSSLDEFLRESTKTYQEKSVIRGLIESGYGKFIKMQS